MKFINSEFNQALSEIQIKAGTKLDSEYLYLKIKKPYDAFVNAKNPNENYDYYRLRTISESNIYIAHIYQNIFKFFHFAWKLMHQNEKIKQDVEDLFNVFIYSDADISNRMNNQHITYLDFESKRIFSQTKVNQVLDINLNLADNEQLTLDIDSTKKSIIDTFNKEIIDGYNHEIKTRINSCKTITDLAQWDFFKLIFNTSSECENKMLELFKALNYVYYKELRMLETMADNDLIHDFHTTLDAKTHYASLKNTLRNDYYTKKHGLNLSNNDVSYSSDIANFYVWRIKLLDYFTKICFGKTFSLYDVVNDEEKEVADKTIDTSFNAMINNPQLFLKNLIHNLNHNDRLLRSDEFNEFGLNKYAISLVELANNYSFNQNLYLHWYYFYLLHYKEHTLYINLKPIPMSDFNYLIWLIATQIASVTQHYWNNFLVLKYSNAYTYNSILKLLKAYNGFAGFGTKKDYKSFKQARNFMSENFIPWTKALYDELSVYGNKRFSNNIHEFLKNLNKNDNDFDNLDF